MSTTAPSRSAIARLASLRRAVRPLALIVFVSVAIALFIAASSLASLIRTLTTRIDTAAAEQNEQKQLDAFSERLNRYTAQVNGRSLFVAPRAVAAADTPPIPEPETREPLRPTRYAGPSVIAMINGAAWFSNGKRVAIGEEADGVRVLSLNAPWSVHVLWEGVEFDVGLFERDAVVYRSGANSPSRGYVAPSGPLSSGATSSTSSSVTRAASAPTGAASSTSTPPPQTLVPGSILLPPPPVDGAAAPPPPGTDPASTPSPESGTGVTTGGSSGTGTGTSDPATPPPSVPDEPTDPAPPPPAPAPPEPEPESSKKQDARGQSEFDSASEPRSTKDTR